MMMNTIENRKILVEAINYPMPFGKYKGRKLINVPEFYYVWYSSKGFPEGKLGRHMALMHEIKINGLEDSLRPLIHVNR